VAQPPALLRRPYVQDSVLALVLAALAFVPGFSGNGILLGELHDRSLDGFGVALGLLQCLPLALRRRFPGPVPAVVGVAFVADQLAGYPSPFSSIGLFVAVYSAGAHQGRWRRPTQIVATLAYAGLIAGLIARGSPEQPLQFVSFYVALLACWAGGTWITDRARTEAERRRLASEAAVTRERSRIARELHDVVTHHVTAMVVQADAAQFQKDPGAVTASLENVSDTGRRALGELRTLLEVLNAPADESRAPVAGRVEDLVEQVRAAGQPVELVVEGSPDRLAGGAELAVYRVVQEGLTNAMKHAAGYPTSVRLVYGLAETNISVISDGPVCAEAGTGHGLAGLRERVAVFGGRFESGPSGEGFAIRARIPGGDA
jgi:signal transduction histidine kinase